MSSRNSNNNSNMFTDYLALIVSDLISGEGKNSFPGPRVSSDIKIDMQETDDNIVITAELPGVNKEDIKIDFYNNQLSIKADKIRPVSQFVLNEIKYGFLERKITLPLCITVKETVSTKYENGNLTITINKLVEESNRFSLSVR